VYTAGPELLAQAKAIHKKYPLLDGHNDLPWALRVTSFRFGSARVNNSSNYRAIHVIKSCVE